jgi:hypothetical protein
MAGLGRAHLAKSIQSQRGLTAHYQRAGGRPRVERKRDSGHPGRTVTAVERRLHKNAFSELSTGDRHHVRRTSLRAVRALVIPRATGLML